MQWPQWQQSERDNRRQTKKREKRKTQRRKVGPWAADQRRRGAAAPSWSSQHLLLSSSQVKHIIPADALLNGFCGDTFAGSTTASADSPRCSLHWHINTRRIQCSHWLTHSGWLTDIFPTCDSSDHFIAQLLEIWRNPSSCQIYNHSPRIKHACIYTVNPTFIIKYYHLVQTLLPCLPARAQHCLKVACVWTRVSIEQKANHPYKNSKHLVCDLATTHWQCQSELNKAGPRFIFSMRASRSAASGWQHP